jgi:hypothetical protein
MLLSQQELMVPPAARRVQVPAGRTAWWGVDVSVRAVSIASVDSEGRRAVCTAPVDASEGGARLAAIWRETRDLAWRLSERTANLPGVVFVEQPSGAQPNPALSYAVGTVQAATVTSSWWKKRACGKGNIYKPKRRGDEYGVLTWARLNGYQGSSWDEADAWAIAEAARREIALVVR